MSVQITSSPFALSWAKNRNAYLMSCSYQDTVGVASILRWTFSGTLPTAGSYIVVSVDGALYPFKVVATANNNAYEVATIAEIGYKMAACWHLQQVFNTSGNAIDATGSKYLALTGKVAGRHNVEIYVTDADGNRISSTLTINQTLNVRGADPSKKPNYAIAARVEVMTNSNNSTTTHTIDGLVFHPDNGGTVNIPFDLLDTLCPQPDLPPTANTLSSWVTITNLLLKYRLNYGEMWGNGTPLMQNWTTLGWNFAFCGEVAERFAELNLPDWQGDTAQFSVTNNVFRILGEDSGQTVRLCRTQAEYIYGMWYDPTQAASATKSVSLSVNIGGTATVSSHTVTNGQIYRIPVGPSALGATTAKCYTVTLSLGGVSWNRTFLVQPDFFNMTRLLLQTKYGYVRSFAVPTQARELTTEAEEMRNDRYRYLDTTDKAEAYTVRTQPMTRYEAKRMAQCIGQEYHYVLCGNSWLRVTIEANTFKVWDEEEDMVGVEFQYRFCENQTENITAGTLVRGSNAVTIDTNGALVTYSDATDNNGNIITG